MEFFSFPVIVEVWYSVIGSLRAGNSGKGLLGRTEGVTEFCDLRQLMREMPRKSLITDERTRLKGCSCGR